MLATLWPVNDVSAALLVSRFFRHHIADRRSPPAALRAAQLWLRELTVQDLCAYIKDAQQSGLPNAVTGLLTQLRRRFAFADKPFQHPFYWGGYTLHGR